jgi:hypothetical protein
MYCINGRIIGRDFTGGNLASSRLKYDTKKGSIQISTAGCTPNALTSVTPSLSFFFLFNVAKNIISPKKYIWGISVQLLFKNNLWKYSSIP